MPIFMHLCMQFSELLENYGIFIHFFITISGSFRILGISVPFYESFVRNSINSDSISQNFLACGELKFGRKSRKSVRLKSLVGELIRAHTGQPDTLACRSSFATGPFGKSRHSNHIYSFQFVHFCKNHRN